MFSEIGLTGCKIVHGRSSFLHKLCNRDTRLYCRNSDEASASINRGQLQLDPGLSPEIDSKSSLKTGGEERKIKWIRKFVRVQRVLDLT